ncbi:hypothetical protein HPB52_012923 [Rhipicephalus sanguineus]|uniref:Uncharacterized protein n=1 Tax=Rhipicephalus sanguineus TaxID=34632 RepID=A0A9D4T3Y0_RHISA|nr:hypothetical protein HPB52_012923 [Rhipicephalus sanguineus]
MAAKYNTKTARQVRQIARASRTPDLPTEDYKVVVRLRGGFNVSDYKMDRIYNFLRSAVEIAISELRIGEREFEASAYRSAPINTSKGLVRGISNDDSPENIVKSLVPLRNPAVLHAKRMGNTDNVTVYYWAMLVRCSLYRKHIDVRYECGRLGHRADVCPNPNSKKCRGCGYSNPPQEHLCDLKCQLCVKGHLTGDRKEEISELKVGAAQRQQHKQQKRQELSLEPQPLPPQPVPVEVNTADDSSVETADERDDHPVSSKRAALDPERPTTEPRSTSYERLKKRIANIETSLDERFVSQTEQINKMFTVVNNSVAKLAEQMTQVIGALTTRMDDFEARPPPLAGRPRKRGNLQQFVCNCERKPDVILLQEINNPVELAGYKAIDAAASSEGQMQRRRRVASTGVMATLPAAAVLSEGKARGCRLRLVGWDAFSKTRKERERGDRPITNIDEWTETLRADVDAATHEVPFEANLQVIDSRLLRMLEAKQALLKRWKRQRHNRTLRRRIAKLDRDTEEHAFQTQMRGASGWPLFRHLRHLLDPKETETAQGHKIRRLVRDFGRTPDEFLEAPCERRRRQCGISGIRDGPDGYAAGLCRMGVDAVQEFLRGTGLECSAAKFELLLHRPTSRGCKILLPGGGRSDIRVVTAAGVPIPSVEHIRMLGLHLQANGHNAQDEVH